MFYEKKVQCLSPSGLHQMAYTEWGDPKNSNVVLCVHGLTRNGRDFDLLASRLAERFRVICPDVVGRGKSDRLVNAAGYMIPQYMADMVTLIARLEVASVNWVGTSMGGLVGMSLAAQGNNPIHRMVLNDVGPVITQASLKRIAAYVGLDPSWTSYEEALAAARLIFVSFGTLTDEQWDLLCRHGVAQRSDGRWYFTYDPRIAEPFRQAFVNEDISLWPVYDAIQCPTLVLRGAESDLLTRETWLAMAERGPKAQLKEFAGVGHAPMFMREEEIQTVCEFLGGM